MMQKHRFLTQMKLNLADLAPFSENKINVSSTYFSKQSGLVKFFVAEIEKTAEQLLTQEDVPYSEFYAEKLIKQFDTLNSAINKAQQQKKNTVQFQSSFQFSTNIHTLSPNKRLQEYRKALRALNEKMSWLMEQNYNDENEALKQELQNQILETEYRKDKCMKAIEDLEQELLFKQK
ncbi:primosomal replication protein PriC [Mannheimia sp. E30BD]|uniref:primosomal replication protein PriC n=1 Tax=Mannheimia sp. E30BD TaxID=3278708 RepID=UPI00359D661E